MGLIYDSLHQLNPYGSFSTSSEFYKIRAELLNKYWRQHLSDSSPAWTLHTIAPADEPVTVQLMIDLLYDHGPFRLAYLNFQLSNFFFDHEFNVTGLVDWSGCQTVPFESFTKYLNKVIPNQDQFFDGWNLPEELQFTWLKRWEFFLDIMKNCERQEGSSVGSPITDMMHSPHSHFMMCLDMEGILGIS